MSTTWRIPCAVSSRRPAAGAGLVTAGSAGWRNCSAASRPWCQPVPVRSSSRAGAEKACTHVEALLLTLSTAFEQAHDGWHYADDPERLGDDCAGIVVATAAVPPTAATKQQVMRDAAHLRRHIEAGSFASVGPEGDTGFDELYPEAGQAWKLLLQIDAASAPQQQHDQGADAGAGGDAGDSAGPGETQNQQQQQQTEAAGGKAAAGAQKRPAPAEVLGRGELAAALKRHCR